MLSVKLVMLINDGIGRRGVEDLFIIYLSFDSGCGGGEV